MDVKSFVEGQRWYNDCVKKIVEISAITGIPTKETAMTLFMANTGKKVGEISEVTGLSQNAIAQILKSAGTADIAIESESVEKHQVFSQILSEVEEVSKNRTPALRNLDQFLATAETVAKRAAVLRSELDLDGKRILFLGDDDLTSLACSAATAKMSRCQVLDIDSRITQLVHKLGIEKKYKIEADICDFRSPLPKRYQDTFDVVFADPPYTPAGVEVFLSRAVEALDPKNLAGRIYLCYGNSDRAKERLLHVQKVIDKLGLLIRTVFDKFNYYHNTVSIGASNLYICEVTAQTRPTLTGTYEQNIYTI